MNTRRFSLTRFFWLLALAASGWFLTGCDTPDVANDSVRPWNASPSWETGGLPATINEGR